MEITLESLGLSAETVQERLIDALCERVLFTVVMDHDGDDEGFRSSKVGKMLDKLIKDRIDSDVAAIAEKHVLPRISEIIEGFCIQKTSEYGEPRGEKLSFVEYLIKRADEYIQEPVNHNGKSKSEDGYNWSKNTTRISYMINSHLQYNIKAAMEAAMKTANASIAGGIEQAVKISLQQTLAKLK